MLKNPGKNRVAVRMEWVKRRKANSNTNKI